MARVTKESLEAKIKKAEERVVKTGETKRRTPEKDNGLREQSDMKYEIEIMVATIAEDNKDCLCDDLLLQVTL